MILEELPRFSFSFVSLDEVSEAVMIRLLDLRQLYRAPSAFKADVVAIVPPVIHHCVQGQVLLGASFEWTIK